MKVISNCKDVIIILPENALERCHEEDDLFRKEIATAIRLNKNIISIVRQGFVFPPENTLPEDIRKFPKYEAIMENPNAYDSVLRRLCIMLKNSRKNNRHEKLISHRRLFIVLTVVLVLFGVGYGALAYNVKYPDTFPVYEYPREVEIYNRRIIEDTGNFQNVYLGLSKNKLFSRIGIEDRNYAENIDKSVDEYIFHLKDVSSFPFSGQTAVLGNYEDFGEYKATATLFFYQNCLEYCNYVIATNDKAEVKKMMKQLYQKYNNGSGEVYRNGYVIHNVQELGGNLSMYYDRNAKNQICFFWKVYTTITPNNEEKVIGNVEISDYSNKEFVTYDYNNKIAAKGIISSVKATRSEYSINLVVEGEKTYDSNDNGTNSLKFDIRALDEDGTIISTNSFYSPKVKTGEKFKVNPYIQIDSEFCEEDLLIEITEIKNTLTTDSTSLFKTDSELEEAGFYFELEDTDGCMERFNQYTNELEYRFQIDTISLKGKVNEYTGSASITILFSGHKLYDCRGDDFENEIVQTVRIKDSSGAVVASGESKTSDSLKTGEKFDNLQIDFFELPPGNYIIDINTYYNNNSSFITKNTKYFNPQRYYTTYIINNILEKGAELPFDSSADWIDEIYRHEIYVDENLVLHGIFTEPYDLHNAEYEKSKTGDTDYYDITDFSTLPDIIPEEAIPSVIRVSVSRYYNILFGERDGLYVFFNYKHNPDDEYSYIALGFESHPGNTLTQEEWDKIVSNAKEDGFPLSRLLERDSN